MASPVSADVLEATQLTAQPGEVAPSAVATEVVVLDTSALVADPSAPGSYPDAHVVVPVTVVEELDSLKARSDEQGAAARQALRTIEGLRQSAGGRIDDTPVPLPGGGTLRVEINHRDDEAVRAAGLLPGKSDNLILATALGQRELHRDAAITLVSHDTALRVKAASFGLVAVERDPARAQAPAHPGWVEVDVEPQLVDRLHRDGRVDLDMLIEQHLRFAGATDELGLDAQLSDNTFVVVRAGPSQSALGRVVAGEVTVLRHAPSKPWGLQPRSKEQQFAAELLFDPSVQVAALAGPAGTGKTLLALAAGLSQVVGSSPWYSTVGVYRPVIGVGRGTELGHLPGSLEEKLDPWTSAVTDALAALTPGSSRQQVESRRDQMVSRGQLEFGSIAHVRGRSIVESWLLIDEAQNLEVSTVKALLTRVGEGSKIVFTGDPSQIDSPWLSVRNNGLSALMSTLAGQATFGRVVLTQGERSQVAELAARLM